MVAGARDLSSMVIDFDTLLGGGAGGGNVNTNAPLTGGGTPPVTLSLAITPTQDGGAVAKQGVTPGTPQTGNFNVTGSGITGDLQSTTGEIGTLTYTLAKAAGAVHESNANLTVRGAGGDQIEFGHNAAGFGLGSNIGNTTLTDKPFIALNAQTGTNADTFKTTGVNGTVVMSDNAGSLVIGGLGPNADNQTLAPVVTLNMNSGIAAGINVAPNLSRILSIANQGGNYALSLIGNSNSAGSGPISEYITSGPGGSRTWWVGTGLGTTTLAPLENFSIWDNTGAANALEINAQNLNVISKVSDKGGQVYNVKSYNAQGDGVTTDTTFVQAAITAAQVTGGTVYFPPGNYLINGTLTVSGSNVILAGAGASSQINYTPTTGDCLVFSATLSGLRDLFIQGSASALAGSLVKFDTCSYYTMSRVTTSAGFNAVLVSNGNTGYISEVTCLSPKGNGMQFSQTGNPYVINTLVTTAALNGYVFDGTQGGYFVQLQSYNCGASGSLIQKTGALGNQYLFFTGCIMDTSTSYNWNMTQGQYLFWANCWGSTGSASSSASQSGFIWNGPVADCYIANCIAINNKKAGFETFGTTPARLHFTNCVASGNNVANSANIGGFHFNTGSGLSIMNSQSFNAASGHQQYGIVSNGSLDFFTFQGNHLYGNATAGCLLTQTPSVNQWVKDNIGWNPQTTVTSPGVAATGVAVNNTTMYDCMVYVIGGTLSGNVQIGGVACGFTATNIGYLVPAGSSITLTYTVAPTWKWIGS